MRSQSLFFLCWFLAIRNWLWSAMRSLAAWDSCLRPKGKEATCYVLELLNVWAPNQLLFFLSWWFQVFVITTSFACHKAPSGSILAILPVCLEQTLCFHRTLWDPWQHCMLGRIRYPRSKPFPQFTLRQHIREVTGKQRDNTVKVISLKLKLLGGRVVSLKILSTNCKTDKHPVNAWKRK